MAEAACSCAARAYTVMELQAGAAALSGAAVECRLACSRRGFFSRAALRAVTVAAGVGGHARASNGVHAQSVAFRDAVELADERSTNGPRISSGKTLVAPTPSEFKSRYAPDEPRKGSDIIVEALEREGVRNVFAYPGGASMEIHQALTRSKVIRNILCRHEQGEIFAAEGYAKASGRVGVCIATSGPGATNLVTGLADAMLDSVPLVAITGQVPRRMIGTDGFQETPIVEVTRSITKHNYLVMNVDDIPRIIREAFFLAASGRPGPVLVDIPKDIQQQMAIPDWDQPMNLRGYLNRLPPSPDKQQIEQVLRLLQRSKKPVIYSGGGCLHASEELREFVELTGIPVASTLMGLGAFPESNDLSLHMLGMHGTVYANYAIDQADLLLAFGVRFDDRVTGKLEVFASRASIVHIDIDPAEIGKNKQPHVSVCGDVKLALELLNNLIKQRQMPLSYASWVKEIEEQKQKWPMKYPIFEEEIAPQSVIQTLHKLTGGKAIISTGVGQHQMWAAQWFHFDEPRRWLTSGGMLWFGFSSELMLQRTSLGMFFSHVRSDIPATLLYVSLVELN